MLIQIQVNTSSFEFRCNLENYHITKNVIGMNEKLSTN